MAPPKKGTGKSRGNLHLVDFDEDEYEKHLLFHQAAGYGYALNLDLPLDILQEQIEDMKKEREGKPLCYRRSFKINSPYCKVCDLNLKCGDNHHSVSGYLENQLDQEPCGLCDGGILNVELLDPRTMQVVNYGCSSIGCPNTVIDQRRFNKDVQVTHIRPLNREHDFNLDNAPQAKPSRKRFEREWGEVRGKPGIDIGHLCNLTVQYMKENGGYLKSKATLKQFLNVAGHTVSLVIDQLIRESRIIHVIREGVASGADSSRPRFKYVLNPNWQQRPDIDLTDDDEEEAGDTENVQ